jgi:cation diffusion facilitator family transporter
MNVRKVLVIEGSINILMMLCKLFVGFMTNSTAIIADALHSLTDVANNIIAWMAVKLSEQPADADHPYGHQKFEQLAVFTLASLLSIVAFEVVVNAVKRFGEPVEQNMTGLVIMLVALAGNIGLSWWERGWAKRLKSDLLFADASHTFGDVLTTVVIIVGWQLAALGYFWLDTLFAIIVAGIIFYLAFKLFQRAIPILVDHSDLDPQVISEAVNKLSAVKTVLRVRSRSSGKALMADVVVTVDPKLTTVESHAIADGIEKVLADKFNIQDVVVHVEPDKG